MPNNHSSDEALARALQAEFSREMNRQQRTRRNNRKSVQPSAPREEVIRGQSVSESDEQYARRVAQEEERLYQYYQRRQSHNTDNSSSRNTDRNRSRSHDRNRSRSNNNYSSSTASDSSSRPTFSSSTAPAAVIFDVKPTGSDDTPATSREGSTIMEFEDAEYARRVEQELNDEELARRLQESDEQRASRNAVRQAATQVEPRPRYSFNCVCGYLVFFTVAGAAAVAFMYFFYIRDNELPGRWIWDPQEFADEDVSAWLGRETA